MVKLSKSDIILLVIIGVITLILLVFFMVFVFSDALSVGYSGPDTKDREELSKILVGRTITG